MFLEEGRGLCFMAELMFLDSFSCVPVFLYSLKITNYWTCSRAGMVARLRSQNGLSQKWLLLHQGSCTWFSLPSDPLPCLLASWTAQEWHWIWKKCNNFRDKALFWNTLGLSMETFTTPITLISTRGPLFTLVPTHSPLSEKKIERELWFPERLLGDRQMRSLKWRRCQSS